MPRAAQAVVAPSTATAPVERPRQARSMATRARLLDAAIDTLVARGYGALTTTEIGRRAGLSQGALFRHFATKADLVGATAEHLFAALIADFRAGFAAAAAQGGRLGVALAQLAKSFAEPRLLAALELYTAARSDRVLRERLAPVLARHHANLLHEARELFPRAARENPDFAAIVDVVIAALQGGALGALVRPDAGASQRALAWLEARLRAELGE
jgi:AcrR family transcriptional regulator